MFTKFSLKRPVTTLLAVLAIVVFGITSLTGLRLELMPDMDVPILLVMTVYPGADPESVDSLVSKEIEDAVGSLSGVDTVVSYSQSNASMVLLEYDYGTDTDEAYLDLRAALDSVGSTLPDTCQDPTVIEMKVDSMPSMTYSVSTTDDSDVLSFVNDEVVPELEAISSVASVSVSGGRENYIKVELNEQAINQYSLSMSDVATAIASTDFTIPLGTLSQGSQDISASSSGKAETIQELQTTPIMTSAGALLQLSDVADVYWDKKDPDSISRFNGQETLTLSVTKNQSASTIGCVNDVKKAISDIEEDNPGFVAEPSYDASELIFQSLSSVASTLITGVILSMIILLIFFGDMRASLIVGCSMPLSLLVTIIMMAVAGFSLNIITLGSLVIAIGMMVDSSIVVIESCFRASDKLPDNKDAAFKGANSVTGSIIASTITTIVVYVPLCIQEGLVGQIFGQLGYTIVFAMTASLVSAITLVPLFYVIYHPTEKKELKINKLLARVKAGYEKLVLKLLRRPKRCVLFAVLLLVAAFALAGIMDTELMPTMDEGMVSITASFRPGTKVEEVASEMEEIESMISSCDDVENYTMTAQFGSATVSVNLKDDRSMTSQEVVDMWMEQTADMTNMQVSIEVSSTMSSMMSMGTSADVTIASTSLEDIKSASAEIQEKAWDLDKVRSVSSSSGSTSTQIKVKIDPLKAQSKGLSAAAFAGGMYSMISGTEAMSIYSDGKEYSVMVEYPDGVYENASTLLNASIYGIPLSEVASLEYTDSEATIQRNDGKYQETISATCMSDDTDTVQDELDELVASIDLPDSVEMAESSYTTMMNDAFTALGKAIAVAVFLVFLVMAMQFESPKYSLMVMISIPFSLIGSFGLLFLTGQAISMTSLMGILMLAGIVVNNGILYVDGVNELRGEGLVIEDALIESGKTRLRPILMTTLTTIISMIPLALGIGTGTVMMKGMAIIIIGGLVTSTLLILILMPVFYMLLYSGEAKKKKKKKKKKKTDSSDGKAKTE